MYHIDLKYGLFSSPRKYYDKDDTTQVCQNLLKYLSLDKFGNDSENFAAILISGHNDGRVCDQLLQRITHGLQSSNFSRSMNPDDIHKYIESVISKFEENFISSMSDLSKKRETVIRRMSLTENQEPKHLQELADMENQLNSGATLAMVTVIKENIYISNIGDNQIILVSQDDTLGDDNQQFILLTDDQSFYNEKEIFRIKEECGLDPDALRFLSILSTERCHSRCIGDFEIKCNYYKFHDLRDAKSSPLIWTPQPSKRIPLEENFTHVLLISSGLYYLVRELIYDKDKVPGEITNKFFELKSYNDEESLDNICKKVVESFVIEHKGCHDQYQNLTTDNCASSEYSHHDDLSLFVIEFKITRNESHVIVDAANGFSLIDSVNTNMSSFDTTDGRDSSNNMKDQFSSLKTSSNACHTPIAAYVDFSEWKNALDKISADDLAFVDSIVDAPETFEDTITEEGESQLVSRSTTFEENNSIGNSPSPQMMFKSIHE